MTIKTKTMDDYQKATIKAKQAFQRDKMDYKWNYKFTEEAIEDGMYFMIANHHKATKIIFDSVNQIIVEKTIYTMDVRTMMELQKDL